MGSALKAYSFTFTAGSVGDRVKFSYPVFDAAGDPIDGSVLDSGLKVAVRAVTDGLTAYTVDSLDRPVLSLTATRDDPAVSDALAGAIVPRPTAADAGKVVTVNDAGTGYELDAAAGGGGGGASEPSVKVVKCDFAFDTPDLLTGAAVYTPTIGDVLLDAWIAVTTPWDGTTPMGDFGTFDVVGWGAFFALLTGQAVDMTAGGGAGELASNALHNAAAGITYAGPSDIFQAQIEYATGVGSIDQIGSQLRHFPAEFITADPIKVIVSQDGTNTGADPAASAGAASLYLVVATPVSPS